MNVIGYMLYQHLYETCHIKFTFHVYYLNFMLGAVRGGGTSTGETVSKQLKPSLSLRFKMYKHSTAGLFPRQFTAFRHLYKSECFVEVAITNKYLL